MQILSNLNYPVGNIIRQEMQGARRVQIAVAFLRYSGVKEIESSLDLCLKNGGEVELIAGLDFKSTDPKAMEYFIRLRRQRKKARLYCFGDKMTNKTDIVFHPKIYLFEKDGGTTGIVGSTNLTRGGLTSNFEVNVIFKEDKPVHFTQLQAIYNSVKFRDSVFAPDEEYLQKYAGVYKAYADGAQKAGEDKKVRKAVAEMARRGKLLPGTVPTLRSLVAEAIIRLQKGGDGFVKLTDIYPEVKRIVRDRKITTFGAQNFDASVRGELNKHERHSTRADNMRLFVRSDKQGFYSLTDKGREYLSSPLIDGETKV